MSEASSSQPPWTRLGQADEWVSSAALLLMVLIPVVEIALRPALGHGIANAPVLVQHLGLLLAMFGALAAERHGHLTSLGGDQPVGAQADAGAQGGTARPGKATLIAKGGAAVICGMLAAASTTFVVSEAEAAQTLAYGIPVWWVQAAMPFGFAALGIKLGWRCGEGSPLRWVTSLLLPAAGAFIALQAADLRPPLLPGAIVLLALLLAGAPIFAILGGLALLLFWNEGQPLASVALSHYQITVNPSLPALPLFTLAGLVFARTGAARRLGQVFTAAFGGGTRGTVIATAVLCSCFTAFTGGSGVTILALGGLLLPLLRQAGYPEQRGISLVTSASALGVLIAPSVPLILYAIMARVPINTMFLAGLIPAAVMVACLLLAGGYLRGSDTPPLNAEATGDAGRATLSRPDALGAPLSAPTPRFTQALWHAKWEIGAPVVAIGSLASGLATPTESAALTAAYALVTQALVHRELTVRLLAGCLSEAAQIIGAVMLVLGMALGLTNFLVDAGIPDAAVEWAQSMLPNKWAFLLALNVFLFAAGALMEIFAAIVVLVPLLLPVAMSYGIDPVHFGIIFLANMELGFLCPPAGMNLYFAASMFRQSMRSVAVAVLPAMLAIFGGTLLISALPLLATGLPRWLGAMP